MALDLDLCAPLRPWVTILALTVALSHGCETLRKCGFSEMSETTGSVPSKWEQQLPPFLLLSDLPTTKSTVCSTMALCHEVLSGYRPPHPEWEHFTMDWCLSKLGVKGNKNLYFSFCLFFQNFIQCIHLLHAPTSPRSTPSSPHPHLCVLVLMSVVSPQKEKRVHVNPYQRGFLFLFH